MYGFELLNELRLESQETRLALQVFIVVFLTLLLNFISGKVLNRLHGKFQKTTSAWDDALVDALRRPLTVLIWVVGIALAAKILQQQTRSVLFEAIDAVRDVGVIVCIGWFLQRFIIRAERNFIRYQVADGKQVDQTTVTAVGKLLRVSVLITAALIILQTLGFSISGVLAFGGIGGVAIGFASKDLLANFFGALMIYLDRPFAVGDAIRSPDRNIEGVVEHIGWRQTRIRNYDKRPVYLPNSTFATIAVENVSRMTHRRIEETIGVRYDDADKLRSIVQDVREMLLAHPAVDQSENPIVNFNKFAPSSLDFFIYAFTRTTNRAQFHEIKEEILLKVVDIIAHHGAEVAFPTSTIHVPGSVRVHAAQVQEKENEKVLAAS